MNQPTATRSHAWRIASLAAAFCVFSSPTVWMRRGGGWPSYIPATIVFAGILIGVVVTWDRSTPTATSRRGPAVGLAVAIAASALLAAGVWYWIGLILANPIDSNRADMLPVIDAALRRFVRGRDPYSIYHVPWEAPLGYGPVLWAPFLVPHLLRLDLRVASVFGQLVVPLWCVAAAVVASIRGRLFQGALWLVLLAAILWNPDLAYFTTVAHTPVFWPLLPLFAVLVTTERWYAAACVLGLIVVGRSTMIAGAPIFFMSVWERRLARLPGAVVLFLTPIVVLMAPFAIWDPRALWYGMVAVYPRVIKTIVWPSADNGILHTIGVTGWLVGHHLGRFVEMTQAAAVLIVYVVAWPAIRRGARPLPWMTLAVLAFCMTTLWPLYYIYFDVLLLLVSGAIAETLDLRGPIQFGAWAISLCAAAILVGIGLRVAAPAYPRIDFSVPGSTRWLYQGFAMSRRAGESSLPWIWGFDGTIALARASNTGSQVEISVDPVVPGDGSLQAVSALLNGRPLGTVQVGRGWQTIRFAAPADGWLIGANALKLVCATATRPSFIGMSDDPRQLSLAIRRVDVVPESGERAIH